MNLQRSPYACCPYLALCGIQILSAASAIGVIVVGCIQLNGSPNTFGVKWCDQDTDCWTANNNKNVALSYYSIALILVGMVGLVTELRIKHYNRFPGFVGLCGAFCIGAAANTGIVLGAFAMFMGFIQLILYVFFGHRKGPIIFAGDGLPRATAILVQILAAICALAVAAVGIMCIVAVSHQSSGIVGLVWCEVGGENTGHTCWLQTGTSDYALGSYGASLMVMGFFLCAVDLRLVQNAEQLQDWHTLGPIYMVLGTLTLGAVGNTGIIVGASTIMVGFLLLSLAVLYDQRLGYTGLSA
eukprot:m.244589 g.244589  ORF g.244589 m.244589 type:complete len:299 (+) comp14475_c0_seq1:191-1087(+)